MSAVLEIHDKTGHRTVMHPGDISGELWIEGYYSGQFVIHHGEMLLIFLEAKIETYIAGWSELGMNVGAG
jgi:hypothetical protein